MNQSSGATPNRGSILVLDADAADRRFVEIGLAKTGRFQIETATSIEGAFEILRGHVVDLVLTEVEFADGDGFHLMKRIRALPGGKDLPVIFLTRDRRMSVLVSALQSGAVDYVGKPFNLPELLARIDAVIARYRDRRCEVVARSYSLAGDLSTISFADLMHLLEIGNREGQLFFTTAGGVGEIKLQKGRIVDASFGTMQGDEAFYALMREEFGRFEYQPGLPMGGVQRTITLPTTSLLLEGARQLDMHRMSKQTTRPAQDAVSSLLAAVGVPVGGSCEVLPRAATPSADFIADLVGILADPFSLGELRYQNRDELVELTVSPEAGKRAFGLLVAPVMSGVLMLAGMAGPLAETHVARALEWDQRLLLWTVTGANGATMDVLLLDCRFPALVLDNLHRAATFIVYAPPHGDHLALSHQSLSELVTVLGHLRPEVILSLGTATIEAGTEQLCEAAGIRPRRLVVNRSIEDPGTDFRQHLADVLEFWGNRVGTAR